MRLCGGKSHDIVAKSKKETCKFEKIKKLESR